MAIAGPIALGAALLMALALAAFWPAYLGRPFARIDAYTHVHATLGAAWLVLLVAQPLAVRRGARTLHRALGRASYALAPAFVVSGVLLAHFRFARMDAAQFERDAFSLYLPLVVALLFGTAWALGILHRRERQAHAMFMAGTATLLIDPVLVRILFIHLPPLPALPMYQAVTFSLTALLLVVMLKALPRHAPGRAAFRAFVGFTSVVLALFFVVPPSAAWFAFAQWFRQLPLT